MSAHPAPVPEDQRAPHDGAAAHESAPTGASKAATQPGNTAQQGQAGNTKQNTTNAGLQQDR